MPVKVIDNGATIATSNVRIVHPAAAKSVKRDREPSDFISAADWLEKSPWWESPEVAPPKIVRMYPFSGGRGGNFGDALSPLVVQWLSGCGKTVSSRGDHPRLFGIGSILRFARPGDAVWGTGTIKETKIASGLRVYAVRGPMTLDLARKSNDISDVPMGDPAVLLPKMWPAPPEKKFKVTVVPHYVDKRVHRFPRDIHVVDVMKKPRDVAMEIAASNVVYSSSLHGCIVAEAYGVPAVWVEMSDKVIGGGWKFRDYYASTDRHVSPVDWRRSVSWSADPPSIRLTDTDALAKSLPISRHSR